MQTEINADIRFNLAITSKSGFAVLPVGEKGNLWCIRTRQRLPRDVIAGQAVRMIVEDPVSIVPVGWNDLPYAYLVQTLPDKVSVIELSSDKRCFIDVTFGGGIFYAITTNGDLITSSQIIEAVKSGNQGLVEFSRYNLLGIPQDARITSLVVRTIGEQIHLLLGVITTSTKNWLYRTIIDSADTDLHVMPVDEPAMQQIIGLRVYDYGRYLLVGTYDRGIWVMDFTDTQFSFRKVYESDIIEPTAGYTTDLVIPQAHASQPGRA